MPQTNAPHNHVASGPLVKWDDTREASRLATIETAPHAELDDPLRH
jgi:hypothetical protein